MALVKFQDLRFREVDDGVEVRLYQFFLARLRREDLERIASFKVVEEGIEFDCPEKRAERRLVLLLDRAFVELKSLISGKKAIYVHRNSGIPLLGVNEFGIVDRGTNLIEVKPLTGCNLSCVYCSVSEGDNKKVVDFLVEEEYLVEGVEKVVGVKEHPVHIYINPQGEPLLYSRIVDLVRDVKSLTNVDSVSVNTNGVLLSKKLIDGLVDAGLDKINLSLNAMDKVLADKISGKVYPLDHVLKMVAYAKDKIDIVIAPTIIPGFNDDQVETLVRLAKGLKNRRFPSIGVQNFLNYKRGRNPVKERSFEEFDRMLAVVEKKTGVLLRKADLSFEIVNDLSPEKPFRKNDLVECEIVAQGRYSGEVIAVAKDRCITVRGSSKSSGMIKVRIVRDKHNIFLGVV